jgi:hypothetical protein
MIIFWVNGRRVDLGKWLKEMFERFTPEQREQFRRNVTRDVRRDVAKQKRDRDGFWTN